MRAVACAFVSCALLGALGVSPCLAQTTAVMAAGPSAPRVSTRMSVAPLLVPSRVVVVAPYSSYGHRSGYSGGYSPLQITSAGPGPYSVGRGVWMSEADIEFERNSPPAWNWSRVSSMRELVQIVEENRRSR